MSPPRKPPDRAPTRTLRADQRGAATAELAMSIPVLVSLTVGLVWLLSIGIDQVRMVDAAREAARAVARGDAVAEAEARGEQVAPAGAGVSVTVSDGLATATASGVVPPPGGLLAFLPAVRLHAEAVALSEEPT
jgi:Flp pilus assembly protein TadG